MTDHFPRAVRVQRHTPETIAENAPGETTQYQFGCFFLRWPCNLALEDGAQFSLRRAVDPDEPPWVEITVRKASVTLSDAMLRPYESGLEVLLDNYEPDHATGGRSEQTWLVAGTGNFLFADEDRDLAKAGQLPSIVFERCLAAANRVVRAEALVAPSDVVRPVAKEALDGEVTYALIDTNTGAFGRRFPLRIHDVPRNPKPVGARPDLHEKVAQAVGMRSLSDALPHPHPLVVSRELLRSAMASVRTGDPFGPILLLQASAERFLRGVLWMMLVDQGRSLAEVMRLAEESTFGAVLRTHLPPLVGGDWNSLHSSVKKYQRDLYDVRGALTHAGRPPGWRELNPAIRALRELVDFVEGAILRQAETFPKTLTALADPWAGGSLKLTKAATRRAEAIRGGAHTYWLPDDLDDG